MPTFLGGSAADGVAALEPGVENGVVEEVTLGVDSAEDFSTISTA